MTTEWIYPTLAQWLERNNLTVPKPDPVKLVQQHCFTCPRCGNPYYHEINEWGQCDTCNLTWSRADTALLSRMFYTPTPEQVDDMLQLFYSHPHSELYKLVRVMAHNGDIVAERVLPLLPTEPGMITELVDARMAVQLEPGQYLWVSAPYAG